MQTTMPARFVVDAEPVFAALSELRALVDGGVDLPDEIRARVLRLREKRPSALLRLGAPYRDGDRIVVPAEPGPELQGILASLRMRRLLH